MPNSRQTLLPALRPRAAARWQMRPGARHQIILTITHNPEAAAFGHRTVRRTGGSSINRGCCVSQQLLSTTAHKKAQERTRKFLLFAWLYGTHE
jgi:hypothetical protein